MFWSDIKVEDHAAFSWAHLADANSLLRQGGYECFLVHILVQSKNQDVGFRAYHIFHPRLLAQKFRHILGSGVVFG